MNRMMALAVTLFAGIIASASQATAYQPYCREFTQQVQVGGRWQEGYGTACMQPDGSWQTVNEPQLPPQMAIPQVIVPAQRNVYVTRNNPVNVIVRDQPDYVYMDNSNYGYASGGSFYYSSPRDQFRAYHHGPGWRQHWKHHSKHYNHGHRHGRW